jgi:predicted AlkP superfamily pyrophosphatase or phosphodiesterase
LSVPGGQLIAQVDREVDRGAEPHVIVIGVDGLSVDGYARAKSPRIHELAARAAWTLEARGVMPTLSSPNWASIISGAGPEQHGITSNGILRKMATLEPVCRGEDGHFPTIFEVLRKQKPGARIAIFHDWDGFADLLEKSVPNVLKHVAGAAKTVQAAAQYWEQNRPDLMFVHLDNVDHAGHEFGWGSGQYLRAVEQADHYVGVILDMVDRLAALDSTYIILTSDHGGKGHNHGKNSITEIQVPWIFAGPDTATGAITSPVYGFDTASTVAWILGVAQPDCWIGRPVYSAFRSTSTFARTNAGPTQSRDCATPALPIATPAASGPGNGSPLARRDQRN